jgi:hypothetical protein
VIHAPPAQPVFRAGRRYLEGITESHCGQSLRLPMKSDLRAEPVATEFDGYPPRQSAKGMVLYSNATQCHKTFQISTDHQEKSGECPFGPEAIEAVLQLQYAILRHMGRIADRRWVRICGDRIGVAACLPSRPVRPDTPSMNYLTAFFEWRFTVVTLVAFLAASNSAIGQCS